LKFILKNKNFLILAGVLLIIIPLLIILAICLCEWKTVSPNYPNGNQWISIFGGLLAYVGTCFMGLLAFWQNIKQREDNEKAQNRLDNFNTRLLKIEEQKVKPVIDIVAGDNFGSGGDTKGTQIELTFINIGDNAVKCLKIYNVSITCNENCYTTQDFYLGGVASKSSITKECLIKDAYNIIAEEHKIKISLVADYQDILDTSYSKKYTFTLDYDGKGKLKVIEELIR